MVDVLVVDDSRVMTKIVSRILEKDPLIRVVGTAANGCEAIEKVEKLKPTVVTMDVEMPVMNGIDALKHIMANNPVPVIMLSSLSRDHADITMEALNLGACDFVTKDFSNWSLADKEQELINKVKDVSRNGAKLRLLSLVHSRSATGALSVARRTGAGREIVAIGASTGGPPVLQYILSRLPGDFPVPVVIAQHMPRTFTQHFAERLDRASSIRVKEAEDREVLQPGVALVAPGDTHVTLKRKGNRTTVELVTDNAYIYRPSVDLLMRSAAQAYESGCAGLILTGMGSDGLAGVTELKSRGGYVIAQDEETCVVYGMPKAVINAHLADAVLPPERIPEEIIRIL
jgi:two-component system chemotaxis response regulator CheB